MLRVFYVKSTKLIIFICSLKATQGGVGCWYNCFAGESRTPIKEM